jgi:hypothetical protein
MKLKPADFARQAGVSRQAVGMKIKNNTLIIDAAGYLDTENPINAAYISDPDRESRRVAHTKPKNNPAIAPPGPSAAPGEANQNPPGDSPAPPTDISAAAGVPSELLELPLRDLVYRYSGLYNLEKHARVLRDITAAAEKEQRIQERSLKLIEKDFVTSRLFQYYDVLMKQIIEYPQASVDDIIAKILSDGPEARGDLIIMMRDNLSRIIAGAKKQIIEELNGLKNKYDQSDKSDDINKEIREAVSAE